MLESQAGKPGIVAVGRDPCCPRLDGQGCVVGVTHKVPPRVGTLTEVKKDPPVSIARRQNRHLFMPPDPRNVVDRLGERRGWIEDTWVGQHSETAAQHEFGNGEWLGASNRLLEPPPKLLVPRLLFSMGIQ